MGCMDKQSCPTLLLHNVTDWDIEDPKGKPIETVRGIRDVIEARVKELVSNLIQNGQEVIPRMSINFAMRFTLNHLVHS